MGTHSEVLAAFVEELSYEDLPSDVVEAAKLHILDTIGLCLASAQAPFGQAVYDVVSGWGGKRQSMVIGFGERLPATSAALANGTLAHGLDFDDTHTGSLTHPSATVVPAALAIAESRGATGREMLVAAVAGWETVTRIGLVRPGSLIATGFHTTPVAGTFGTAVVAGKLLGLPQRVLVEALGICGSQATGLQEFLSDGASVKRLHAGWAAHAGIAAVQFAQHGFTGPHSVRGPFWLVSRYDRRRAIGPCADHKRARLGMGDA